MRAALKAARNGIGTTHPNPRVGAVVVRDGKLVGRGWHRFPGGAHAEVAALHDAGELAQKSTMVVTLEPCAAMGRTPPCTEALLAAGVTRVVYGSSDSNPRMAGGGDWLRSQGVTVVGGVLQAECDALNRPFFHGMARQRPWILVKAATSLDGKLATAQGDSRWISNPASRHQAHRLRAEADAVLIGAGTLRADNPQLIPRQVRRRGANPLRVVISRQLPKFLSDYQLADTAQAPSRIYCQQAADTDTQQWLDAGVEVVRYQLLADIFAHLYIDGRLSVMVEGGGQLLGALWQEKLVDALALFQAPLLIGGEDAVSLWGRSPGVARVADAPRLIHLQRRHFGDNTMVYGEVVYPDSSQN
ncbi:MAG: bifunctional diaminohydroxyphosphoribosylaminopyrimidine deaminase/5-amino-6-(5-phosphoribosylamino)uracil reductase RibD [Mariprofundales bacterium]|nr:bifunctional diaminohydroxyphosphoribosylaminopyrimidine deaminase/5-amino-6-(5-phosphoribosylamino)uracil reductase RibD [Mariprofundales bacterium]